MSAQHEIVPRPVEVTLAPANTGQLPAAHSEAADRALLRRFEPVIRFTRGERFFPTDVDRYVRGSSLWMQREGADPVCLVPEGELTLEKLAEPRSDAFGTVYFLKFIEPLNITEMAAYAVQEGLAEKDPDEIFEAGRGRLARVGYSSRLVDALFTVTLLARGRVPGDTAAAAALFCKQLLAESEHHCYYGRVVRVNGWVALQYWFFYPFNNWRSGFFGANDHEADWEMIYVYLAEAEDGELKPEWVAYASHDFSGDDLRRRWDDPELEKVGEHPVIYAGAGSHASYFAPGEYLAEIELPFLMPLVRLVDRMQEVGRRLIRQARGEGDEPRPGPSFNIFRIPFVDYARGDGLVIGPGGDRSWGEPVVLNEDQRWALNYRGLWGLYARDPMAGENAPAGPVYNRDGTMRRSWYDPLGWAGLDKVPPPAETLAKIREQKTHLVAERARLETAIADKSRELSGLGVEAAAMQGHPHLRKIFATHQDRITELSRELNQMRAELAGGEALRQALELHSAEVQAGYRGPVRGHIRRAHHPAPEENLRLNRFAEFWAAISIGLMMLAVVGLVMFARQYLIFGLAALLALIIFVEASFRRRLAQLVNSVTVALAIVAALVLLFEFFWQIVVFVILLGGAYIIWENVRELRA
jgi:hypothetical protein